jgi:5-(carboxyamino)imidazole ribonucleotide mutase
MNNTPVAIVMGSKSDLDIVQGAFDILDKFGVKFNARVLSAHRTPAEAAEFAATAEEKGFKVIELATGYNGWIDAVRNTSEE